MPYHSLLRLRFASGDFDNTLIIDVNYIPEKTSFLVNSIFSAGAINIDDEGIVKITARES